MAKNKQSNLIACRKLLNIGFIKNIYAQELGGYLVLVIYRSLLSHLVLLVPSSQLSLWNAHKIDLLFVSFIELLECVIYQFLNKIIEILPLASSHKAHLCNQANHVFALLISMPQFKTLYLYL